MTDEFIEAMVRWYADELPPELYGATIAFVELAGGALKRSAAPIGFQDRGAGPLLLHVVQLTVWGGVADEQVKCLGQQGTNLGTSKCPATFHVAPPTPTLHRQICTGWSRQGGPTPRTAAWAPHTPRRCARRWCLCLRRQRPTSTPLTQRRVRAVGRWGPLALRTSGISRPLHSPSPAVT